MDRLNFDKLIDQNNLKSYIGKNSFLTIGVKNITLVKVNKHI